MSEEKQTNGWTQYQKLVLAELERHEGNLIVLQKELSMLRTDLAKFETQFSSVLNNIQNSILEIKNSQIKIKEEIEVLDKASEDQKLNLTLLQWKVTGIASIFSSVAASIFVALVKKFFG